MNLELVLEKSVKSKSNHKIFFSILKRKKFLLVEIAINNGVDSKVISVRLRSREFQDIFADLIRSRREHNSLKTCFHYWLWYGRSRNVRFDCEDGDFHLQIFYDYRSAHLIGSNQEDLESLLDLIENHSILERLQSFEKKIKDESYRPLVQGPDGRFHEDKS